VTGKLRETALVEFGLNTARHFDFIQLFNDLVRTRGNEYKLVQHVNEENLTPLVKRLPFGIV